MNISALLLSFVISTSAGAPTLGSSPQNPQLGDLYTRMQQLEEQNRRMQGQTEELEHKIQQLESKNQALQKNLTEAQKPELAPATPSVTIEATSANPIKSEPLTPKIMPSAKPKVIITPAEDDETPEAKTTKEAKDKTDSHPNEEFETAFTYMTDGFIDEAKKGFNAFVKKYPSSALAGEAYYWLGEISFDEADYNNAAISYLKGYKEYPKGAKAPENILKLAQTLKALGKNAEACQNLARFSTEFKTAHANLRAKAENDRLELKCK